MWNPPWIVISKPSNTLPNGTQVRIAAFTSADNVQRCHQAEVGEVCIPQRGGKKSAEQEALERSPAFKKAQRFRVGIEGRISVLFPRSRNEAVSRQRPREIRDAGGRCGAGPTI